MEQQLRHIMGMRHLHQKRKRPLRQNPSKKCWKWWKAKHIYLWCWEETESSFRADMETERKMEPTTYFTSCSLRLSLSLLFSLNVSSLSILSLLCRYSVRMLPSSLDPVFGPLFSSTVDERTVGILSDLKKKKTRLICSCCCSSGVKEQQSRFVQVQKNALIIGMWWMSLSSIQGVNML